MRGSNINTPLVLLKSPSPTILIVKAIVLISDYDCPMYRELYSDCKVVTKKVTTNGSVEVKEFPWISPHCQSVRLPLKSDAGGMEMILSESWITNVSLAGKKACIRRLLERADSTVLDKRLPSEALNSFSLEPSALVTRHQKCG